MAWTKLDDRFWSHPKIAGLSDQAFRLYVTSLNWSVSHLTDGHVPDAFFASFRIRNRARFESELVNCGLWKPHDLDGFWIHDYSEYQPTKSQVLQERQRNRERQARHRNGKQTGDNTVSNAVTNGVTNTAPTRPDPLPTSNEVGVRTDNQQSHDAVVAALIDAHGEPATEREWGKYHDTAKRLREGNVTPGEYPRLVDAYRSKHGEGVSFSVATVSNRIGELRHHLLKQKRRADPVVVDPASCTHPVVGSVDGAQICAACGTELEDGAA